MKLIKLILLTSVLLLTSCSQKDKQQASSNFFYLNTQFDLATLGKVAFVEFSPDFTDEKTALLITNEIYKAMLKQQLFSPKIVPYDDPVWKNLVIDPASPLTINQMESIRISLDCNAILTGYITQYQPYPHLAVGLRMKLVDLEGNQLLWATEQIWDTADKNTLDRLKKYYEKGLILKDPESVLNAELAAVSPIKFFNFVAHEVSQTLRPK